LFLEKWRWRSLAGRLRPYASGKMAVVAVRDSGKMAVDGVRDAAASRRQ
jgi:hypothetical protein